MATIKSYTDIEQSKKLAEILPLESADMHTILEDVVDEDTGDIISIELTKLGSPSSFDFPCWSLAALLEVLPDYTLQTNMDGTVFAVCESKKPMISDAYDNPVDACVAMVEKLKELNLL